MKTPCRLPPAAWLFLAGLCPLVRAADPVTAMPDETLTLPKVEVKGNAICSYGIGIIATWSAKTQSISHLFIDEVIADSPADKLGLKRGDEILAINGRKISEMKGGLSRGSDLFDLLVDQPPGRTIKVEVAVRTVKRLVLTATP